METFMRQVNEAAHYLTEQLSVHPAVAVILGTGLGNAAESVSDATTIPYSQIPHFPVSTAPSHEGRLVCGDWAGQAVLVMQGRFHLYEGYTPLQISFPIRVMASLGVRTLIVTNAVGGLNPHFRAGDLMLVTDHINLTGHNPLTGPNVDAWGPRFPEMTEPYCRKLQQLALDTALAEKILLHRGAYAGVTGPSLETAAETRFLRIIGADAVGMSLIMENITAVHAGIKVLGISVITNVNLPDHYQPAPLEQILATANEAAPRLHRLMDRILRGMEIRFCAQLESDSSGTHR
jgi:purine-nucleoside phosphorylase